MGVSGRVKGKNKTRDVTVEPGSAEGRDIGLSERQLGTPSPIPGGEHHILNHQTMRQQAPTPAPKPEFRGTMAHGVPAEKHTAHERANAMRGPNTTHDPKPEYQKLPRDLEQAPVPVRIVENGSDIRALITTSHRNISAPGWTNGAPNADPVRLVGRNSRRKHVLVLNEDPMNAARFASTLPVIGIQHNGSLLPNAMTSYLKIETEDELFCVSDTANSPRINIIEVFDLLQSEVQ
jgi:hypothetical protein